MEGTAAESPGGRVRKNAEALSTQPALIQCLEAKPRGASYGSQVESREKAQVFHQRDRERLSPTEELAYLSSR